MVLTYKKHNAMIILLLNERFGGVKMSNLILFLNSFLSYLLVMAVIVVLAGLGIFIGIKMRKRNNEKSVTEVEAQS